MDSDYAQIKGAAGERKKRASIKKICLIVNDCITTITTVINDDEISTTNVDAITPWLNQLI